MIILTLVVAVTITILLVALLAIVIVGIHMSERHMNLTYLPVTPTEKVARWVLGTPTARRR